MQQQQKLNLIPTIITSMLIEFRLERGARTATFSFRFRWIEYVEATIKHLLYKTQKFEYGCSPGRDGLS